jgi:hypothetical protein
MADDGLPGLAAPALAALERASACSGKVPALLRKQLALAREQAGELRAAEALQRACQQQANERRKQQASERAQQIDPDPSAGPIAEEPDADGGLQPQDSALEFPDVPEAPVDAEALLRQVFTLTDDCGDRRVSHAHRGTRMRTRIRMHVCTGCPARRMHHWGRAVCQPGVWRALTTVRPRWRHAQGGARRAGLPGAVQRGPRPAVLQQDAR